MTSKNKRANRRVSIILYTERVCVLDIKSHRRGSYTCVRAWSHDRVSLTRTFRRRSIRSPVLSRANIPEASPRTANTNVSHVSGLTTKRRFKKNLYYCIVKNRVDNRSAVCARSLSLERCSVRRLLIFSERSLYYRNKVLWAVVLTLGRKK